MRRCARSSPTAAAPPAWCSTTARAIPLREGIIGAIHPHVLPEMVAALPAQVAKNALRTHITAAACFTVHAALDAPLKFKAKNATGAIFGGDVRADARQLRDDAPRLRRSALWRIRAPRRWSASGQLTQHDPSRAPEGKAIFHAWDYVPYDRPDGRELGRYQARISPNG